MRETFPLEDGRSFFSVSLRFKSYTSVRYACSIKSYDYTGCHTQCHVSLEYLDHHNQAPYVDPGFICSELSLSGDPASIDDQRRPDGEFCVVGTKIQDSSGDLFGDARSSDRNHRRNLIANGTFSETIEHFSGDHPGRNGVDANVSSGEFERDRFGQAFNSVLGSNINADLTQTNVPRHAGIVDYGAAAVLEHGRNFVTHRIENAPNVDVENAPILSFGRLIERAFPFNTGIVKRNVETSEFIDREIDHRFHVGIFRNVRAHKSRIAAEFFNFGNDL